MAQMVLRNPVRLPSDLSGYNPLIPAQQPDTLEQQQSQRLLLCSRCQWPITDETRRIAIAGNHEHTVFNPHGIVFQIGCFQIAPGCDGVGDWSGEFSWFRDYLWQIVLCHCCQWHIGWRFRSQTAAEFFGLILNRLTRSS
ncbi:MAG: hypothetical protein HQL58_03450 [Magnetococcales bacterium]|nr:hypothetical protein [Magnetococcales bacterium]